MRIIEAVKIVKALHEIKDQSLPIKTSYAIVMTLKELEPHVSFYIENEKKLISKYADDLPEDGKFSVKQSDFPAFMEEKKELDNLDIDVTISKIILPSDLTITPTAMNTLMEYVELEEAQ